MKICPSCEISYSEFAKSCRRCGGDLAPLTKIWVRLTLIGGGVLVGIFGLFLLGLLLAILSR